MSDLLEQKEALTGLGCPRCGGMVPIPEGQMIVICPYCDLRSSVCTVPEGSPIVSSSVTSGVLAGGVTGAIKESVRISKDEVLGEGRGIRRYQAPLRVKGDALRSTFQSFLSGKISVARDAAAKAQISEIFLVHLPFWAAWGQAIAYAFGQQRVGSGKHQRYEPREKKVIRELNWNGPACEVGEFGVRKVGLQGCQLEPFNAESLHRTGMVFEPVGSAEEALESARAEFENRVKSEASLSRVSQLITRILRPRLAIVYYPMWVIRYLYRGRSFQVVIDGYDGHVLYGKAPGSVFFRSAALVGGMAGGAAVAIDIPAVLLMLTSGSSDDDGLGFAALVLFVVGLGIMYAAYRTYRYGEHYEYHRFKDSGSSSGLSSLKSISGVADLINNNPSEIGKQIEEVARNAGKGTGL